MNETLVTENLKLVPFMVRKYFRPQSDFEDLCSIGNIGLVRAAKTYDPDKKIAFSTYASRCIFNELTRAIALRTRKKRVAVEGFIYLDMDGDKEANLYKLISSEDTGIEDIENKIYVEYLLSLLNEREKQLLILYFGLNGVKPMDSKEISKRMGCTPTNVSRLIRQALKHIRTRMEVHHEAV